MRHKKRTRLRLILFLIISMVIILVFFSARNILNNLMTNTNSSENNSETNLIDNLPNLDLILDNTTNENQIDEKKPLNKENCTWQTIKDKVEIKEYVEDISYIEETKYSNQSYSFELETNTIRSIKREVNKNEVQAHTFYNKKEFQNFYDSILISGWFSNSQIATYTANNSDSTFTIKNNNNEDATYTIYRLYPTIKNEHYFDSKPVFEEITIKKNKEKDITIDNSILCYHLKKNSEFTNFMQYYQNFYSEYKKIGLSNDDYIVFDFSNEYFACVRPYFAIIPHKYQKEYTVKKKIDNSYYKTTESLIDKFVCT